MLYRIEHKSTGDKILSAFGPSPIISLIGGTDADEVVNWIVVEYDNPEAIIPNKSWGAVEFYIQTSIE